MKIVIRLLLLGILCSFRLSAQSNFTINFGTPEADVGFCIRQTFNHNYIIAGSTETPIDNDENVYLSLVDSNGNVLWSKTYGGTGNESANCVRQTSDSGFIMAGVTDSYGAGFTDFYIIRTDKNGDTLWTKTFGGTEYDYGLSVENTLDGGFIFSGQESSTNGGIANIYVIKTDASGNSQWTKSFPMGAWTGAISAIQTPDSGYVVFGDFENNVTGLGDYDLYWMKLDKTGNILLTRTFEDSTSNDYAEAFRKTNDGGFIIGSEKEATRTLTYTGSTIIKLDANLDTVWTKKMGMTYNYSLRDIIQSCDSGFITTGYSYDTLNLSNVLFITKFSATGDSLWNIYNTGLYESTGYSIDATADDSIVVCGSTANDLGDPYDVFIIKSENGGCGGLTCVSAITGHPQNILMYENHDTTFSVTAAIQSDHFQWQVDSIGTFVDLQDDATYSGTNTNTLSITAAQLTMDGYHFRCIVHSPVNCTDTSNGAILSVITDPNAGIKSVHEIKIALYPNPSATEIILSGPVPAIVFITDLYGKTIAEYTKVHQIDISNLSNGIYFLKVMNKNNSESFIQRFIKN
jgi:hypothetical protein